MLTVGLTGGIASGKSTVAEVFREGGAVVLDADAMIHDAFEPGGELTDLVIGRFGDRVRADDGSIDRTALGAIVFADPEARHDLEAIVHPWVRAEARRRLDRAAGVAEVGVFDAALLVESGGWKDFDRLVVTACSEATQLARLRARDGLDERAARRRIAAQFPLERKRDLADHVVDTEGTLEQTRERARELWTHLLADARATPPAP